MWKSWGGRRARQNQDGAVRGVPILRGGDKKRDGSITPHRERRCSTAKGGRERRTWLEEEGGQRARAREHERVLPGQRQEVSGRPVGAPRLTYPMACVCTVGGESRWCKHRTPGRGALTFGTRASHVEERCLERCVWRIVPGSRQAGAYRRPLEKAHAAGSVIGGDGGGCKLEGRGGRCTCTRLCACTQGCCAVGMRARAFSFREQAEQGSEMTRGERGWRRHRSRLARSCRHKKASRCRMHVHRSRTQIKLYLRVRSARGCDRPHPKSPALLLSSRCGVKDEQKGTDHRGILTFLNG